MCLKQGEICQSREGNNNFYETGGKCTETEKIGGIPYLWSMTKKRSSEISADKNQEISREKVKL